MGNSLNATIKAFHCRCPKCGKGRLFKGFITLVDHCASCGLAIAKNDNGDGPAVFLIFILGFLMVPPAIIIAMHVDWPLWVHGTLWGALILGATLGMLRPAKALTMAMQFKNRPEIFTA
ncbi:MAG: DUF983 domain-containing protein [Alphaproteobacteria bacterium]|nr:DUF983 domain-containing protein [Alphaproteobacteria bacterium]